MQTRQRLSDRRSAHTDITLSYLRIAEVIGMRLLPACAVAYAADRRAALILKSGRSWQIGFCHLERVHTGVESQAGFTLQRP